jgi:hypothetical protein
MLRLSVAAVVNGVVVYTYCQTGQTIVDEVLLRLISTYVKRACSVSRALAFIQLKMFIAIKTSYYSVICQK